MRGADVLVSGGTVVTPDSVFKGDILVTGGRIVKVGMDLTAGGARVLDATGLFVLPGAIDGHVHMRDPGLTEKEDFSSGTAAAAAGGVTTVLEMPNTLPPVESVWRLLEKKEILSPKAVVDFGLYAVLHDGNASEAVGIATAGAVGFKAFMGPTTGNIPPPSDASIFESLSALRPLGVPVAFHAENQSMVNYYTDKVRASGRMDPRAHCDARPPICETEAVNRVLFLASRSRGKAHIVHISTAEAVRLVEENRARGTAVTCETCPQYLSLTEEDMARLGGLGKINPPLRGEADRNALWDGIANGVVECIGSDHAPHLVAEKLGTNIWEVPSGFIGVETLLPIMLDFAGKGRISLQRVAALLSRNPAKLYGIERKGEIKEGADGDLAVVDLTQERTIRADLLHSKQKVTPFEGRKVRATIKYTIVRGNVVYDGEVLAPAGEWVKPRWADASA
jgi:allantoinase